MRGLLPFNNFRDLHQYAYLDLLEGVHFRKLKMLRDDTKPLHLLAAGRLRSLIYKYGLQAVKKRFSPTQWVYIEKTLFQILVGREIPDFRLELRRSIEDWLGDRILFPRFREG